MTHNFKNHQIINTLEFEIILYINSFDLTLLTIITRHIFNDDLILQKWPRQFSFHLMHVLYVHLENN